LPNGGAEIQQRVMGKNTVAVATTTREATPRGHSTPWPRPPWRGGETYLTQE
jgi:hypothetical protein